MSKQAQITHILAQHPDGLTATEIATKAGVEFWRARQWGQSTLADMFRDGAVNMARDDAEGLTLYHPVSR